MIRLHPYDIFMLIDKHFKGATYSSFCSLSDGAGTYTIDGTTYQETTEVPPSAEAKAYVG